MKFFRYVILFGVLLTASPQSPSSHDLTRELSATEKLLLDYDDYVRSFVAEAQIPGVAIAVVAPQQTLYMKSLGYRKAGSPEPIDANTVFRLASVSKGFASVLTGLLVQEGALQWDDPVTQYVPDFALQTAANTRALTIRHVLSHTSGLISHAYDSLVEDNLPLREMVPQLREVKITCATGECYTYQNLIYSLIEPVIATRTQRTYEDLLVEKIFAPLGMRDASLSKNEMLARGNFASPHIMRGGAWQATTLRDTYYNVAPAAGVNASIHDMALWLRALLGGMPEIIPPEVVQKVSAPVIDTPRERRRFNWNRRIRSAHYGLGWRIFDYAGHKMVYHSGGVRGYSAQIAFLPEEKIGIVVLQNSSSNNPLVYEFLERYLNLREYP